MTKKIILVLSLFLLSSKLALAATSTVTATPSATNSTSEEIQKIRQAVQEKVKEKLQQITNPVIDTKTPKSIIGNITQISNNQIIISTKDGSKTVNITDDSVFIDIKRNKTTLDKIKVGQDILVMGYFNSNTILEAKRVVVIDLKALENKHQVIVGKIVDISKSSPIFVLIPTNNKNTQYQIKTDSKTVYIDQGNKVLDIKKLVSGQKIIAIIQPDTELSSTFYVAKIISVPGSIINNSSSSTSSAVKK
jgi:hypothetical protein